jgi:hypothetical protein
MPAPISSALSARRMRPRSARLTCHSARPEAAIGSNSESIVIGVSKAISIGSWKASMPTKCMAQMPEPMAIAPPTVQASMARPLDSVTRPARLSAE